MVTSFISFFATRKYQNIQRINENSYSGRRKSSYFLNDLINFNEIFRKDVAYDNMKRDEKARFYTLCRKHTFGSQEGGSVFMPNIFGVTGWRPATLLKRDSGTVVFLWILHNFCYFVKHFEKLTGLFFLRFHFQLFLAWMWRVSRRWRQAI